MTKVPKTCKCLDIDDKKFMLKIIDNMIDIENAEIRKIISRQEHEILKPSFAKPFVGIRVSLIGAHEDFKKKVENLKNRIDEYHECETGIMPQITSIGVNVPYPGYYHERRKGLFY